MNDNYDGYVTRNNIVKAARRLKEQHGARLSLETFCGETGFPRQIVLHLFESWDKVRRTIGLAPLANHKTRRMTDQEICDLLIQYERQREGKLAKWEFCRLIGITCAELDRRFRSWFDLRESVGLPHRRVHRILYAEEDIEKDMLQVYLRVGFCPGFHQWKLWGGNISASTLRCRYKSWKGVRIRFEIMRYEHHMRLDPTWTPQQHAAEMKRRREGRANSEWRIASSE